MHTRQLCFLQLFLRHTLRAGTQRELCAVRACTHVVGQGWGEGGRGQRGCRCRGQHSRVFLVPIHNCKFPSPYLCSLSSHHPGSVCRFANTGPVYHQLLPVQTRQTKNDVFFFSRSFFLLLSPRRFPTGISIVAIKKFRYLRKRSREGAGTRASAEGIEKISLSIQFPVNIAPTNAISNYYLFFFNLFITLHITGRNNLICNYK